ncbi:MAG: hypothetical protein LKM36_15765 [Flavobacteriales bacterium]|jgi:hypothetical protein|nr:hypothetical protein [Flavobacteriales bacterium]MCI1754259.1 hypothetical protein [Flavobacteriales bacterium]
MTKRAKFRKIAARVVFFFPLQLLLLHLKKNHVTVLCWLVFFGYITQSIGLKYGIPYLFLYPEYFGTATVWSFMILGFALGGFITAFNLFTYTLHAYRFPFVATLAKPFLKFNINNSIIPVLFILTYLVCSFRLQTQKELVPVGSALLHLLGFLVGIVLFLMLARLYFMRTNTDLHQILGKDIETLEKEAQPMVDIIPQAPSQKRQEQRRSNRWLRRAQFLRKWRVDTYLTWPFRLALARSSTHYDKEMLRAVLWQNHINGSIFEIAIVASFIALGAFSNTPFFAIPAGASVFLLFTVLLMLFSAFTSWIKGWLVTAMLLLAVGLNTLSLHSQRFLYDAQAYGLNYDGKPAPYDRETILALATDTGAASRDAELELQTLERWKEHNDALPHAGKKPVLIIVNTSGGGSRALLWTFRCLQVSDSMLGGDLMDRTALVTGSSGGLIGATYFMRLETASDPAKHAPAGHASHLDRLASDILNPVTFSLVTNDMFIRYRKVHDQGRTYTLDRGFAFEQRMDSLTGGLFNIRLGDLTAQAEAGKAPLLVISPTSANDGRRVLISPQPVSYLTAIEPEGQVHSLVQPESVEFTKLFKDQSPMDLKLSSALRMNASFPYITPIVSLPSRPKMRVMDAGVRDNYGYRTTFMFLYTFRDWISENTGGVVILQMRDKQRELEVKHVARTLFDRLLDPVSNIYGNFVKGQDQDYDLMVKQSDAWVDFPLHIIDLQLRHDDDDEISLSWHLTAVEKKQVLNTIQASDNQAALGLLKTLVIGEQALSSGASNGSAPSLPSDPAVPR